MMNVRMHALSLVAAAAGALAFVAPVAAQNAAARTAQTSACTLSFAPQAVTVQSDPFQLAATPSQSIGAVSAASIQEKASGLQVAVASAPAAEAQPTAAPSGASSDAAAAKPAAAPAAQPAPAAAPAAQAGAPAQAATPATQAQQLSLNTAAARAGDWTVTLQGASGTCSGKIHVDAAAPKK